MFFKKDGKAVPIIDVLKVGKELCFDQMIAYPTFVHFSYTRLREQQKDDYCITKVTKGGRL